MSFANWLRELAIGWIKLKKLSFDLLLKWTETRPMALFRVSKHPNGPVRRAELVMVSCTSNVNFLLKRTRFRNKANFLDMTSKAGQVQWQAILLLFRSKQFWHFVPLKNDLAQIKVFSCFNWSTKRAFFGFVPPARVQSFLEHAFSCLFLSEEVDRHLPWKKIGLIIFLVSFYLLPWNKKQSLL